MRNLQISVWVLSIVSGVVIIVTGIGGVTSFGGTLSPIVVGTFLTLALGVAIVPSLFVGRFIVAPLESFRKVIDSTQSDRDISRSAPVVGSAALAATAYNAMLSSFHSIITRIFFNAKQVDDASNRLTKNADHIAASSTEQFTACKAATEFIAAMGTGTDLVLQRSSETQIISKAAYDDSLQGREVVDRAAAEIEQIAASVESSAKVVTLLGDRTKAISGIVQSIREIADQTNLLALNAAIEAARAGDQGRGFAVVADEVRKLAERTSVATVEIDRVTGDIMTETKHAIDSIRAGTELTKSGSSLARQASDALRQINIGAQETMQKVTAIAQAVTTQHESCSRIAQQISSIMKTSERNSVDAKEAADDAKSLSYMAGNLKEVSTIFKLGSKGAEAIDVHEKMPMLVQKVAKDIGHAFESAIKSGQIQETDLFDKNYQPISNIQPQKYGTKYDKVADKLLPPLQEPVLNQGPNIAYAICCDPNGYVPTHNNQFCQPLTGVEKADLLNNRTKRIFGDPVGKRCGAHELPYLLQTYQRDTGEVMHDISTPIYINGKHWGGFRIGYKT